MGDGWRTHVPPFPPLQLSSANDVRVVHRIEDVMDSDHPENDTQRFFPGMIGSKDRDDLTGRWTYGHLAGEDNKSETTISFAPTWKQSSELRDAQTATHSSFIQKYVSLPRVGFSWGGYYDFQDWQRAGRNGPAEMVPLAPSSTSWHLASFPTVMVPEDGEPYSHPPQWDPDEKEDFAGE